jgi:hypothetical protein
VSNSGFESIELSEKDAVLRLPVLLGGRRTLLYYEKKLRSTLQIRSRLIEMLADEDQLGQSEASQLNN